MRKRSKTFLDTSVFVYAIDSRFPDKQRRAVEVIAGMSDSAVVSTQVIQEFFYTATRKLNYDPLAVRNMAVSIGSGTVVSVSPELVFAAIDTSVLNRLSIWDALMIQAAVHGKCARILTEELSHGQVVQGVLIENPFHGIG